MFEFLIQPHILHMDPARATPNSRNYAVRGLLGLGLGTLLAIGDIYGGKPAKGAIAVYVEFFRGSPLFVQLFIAVYTVPAILQSPDRPSSFGFPGFWIKQCWLPERLHERRNANHTWMTKWRQACRWECQKSKRFAT